MSNSKLIHEIEQQLRVVKDKQAAYDEARTSTMPLLNEVERLSKSGKITAKHKDKVDRANVLGESLKRQAEGVIAEQNKLIGMQNAAIRDVLEKQHGLLAYGLATGGKLG